MNLAHGELLLALLIGAVVLAVGLFIGFRVAMLVFQLKVQWHQSQDADAARYCAADVLALVDAPVASSHSTYH